MSYLLSNSSINNPKRLNTLNSSYSTNNTLRKINNLADNK